MMMVVRVRVGGQLLLVVEQVGDADASVFGWHVANDGNKINEKKRKEKKSRKRFVDGEGEVDEVVWMNGWMNG